MWNEISNENDLKKFMDVHYGFHDSCLKELKYISGAYVNKDLSMHPINDKRFLKMIIQRQFRNSSTIELEFIGLKYLRLYPNEENYTCEIFGITMFFKNDCIYWCDCDNLLETDLENYEGTIICASKVRWRVVEDYLGSEEVYR